MESCFFFSYLCHRHVTFKTQCFTYRSSDFLGKKVKYSTYYLKFGVLGFINSLLSDLSGNLAFNPVEDILFKMKRYQVLLDFYPIYRSVPPFIHIFLLHLLLLQETHLNNWRAQLVVPVECNITAVKQRHLVIKRQKHRNLTTSNY